MAVIDLVPTVVFLLLGLVMGANRVPFPYALAVIIAVAAISYI